MDNFTDIKYEPCDHEKSGLSGLINKCYYVILSKEDPRKRDQEAIELFAMKPEEKTPKGNKLGENIPQEYDVIKAKESEKLSRSELVEKKISDTLRQNYASEDKLAADKKARQDKQDKIASAAKARAEEEDRVRRKKDQVRRADYEAYGRREKDTDFEPGLSYDEWLEKKQIERQLQGPTAKQEAKAKAKLVQNEEGQKGGGKIWFVPNKGGPPKEIDEDDYTKYVGKGKFYASKIAACVDDNASCGGGEVSARAPRREIIRSPEKSSGATSGATSEELEQEDKMAASIEKEKKDMFQNVKQKLDSIQQDNDIRGRFIFLFKLDIDVSNEFNNKHIFDNICASNIPGEGDYVIKPGAIYGNTMYIIKKTFFDQNLEIYAIVRQVDQNFQEIPERALEQYPVNQLQKIETQSFKSGAVAGQLQKIIGRKVITEQRVIPMEPIKYINGLLLNLDHLQEIINNPPDGIFNYLVILERYVTENYGNNGELLANVLRQSIQSRTLDKLLFLLLNKYEYNVFGNKDFAPRERVARQAAQVGNLLRDTMENELPCKLYLQIFLKIMNTFTYFPGRNIIYKTAKLTKIRNGKCNILVYTDDGPTIEFTDFTIYEKDYNQIINLDREKLFNIQTSLIIETIFEKIIRYTLIYFAHLDYHTFTNCEKIEYYNVFKSNVQTALSMIIDKQLIAKINEHKAQQQRIRLGKLASDTVNMARGAVNAVGSAANMARDAGSRTFGLGQSQSDRPSSSSSDLSKRERADDIRSTKTDEEPVGVQAKPVAVEAKPAAVEEKKTTSSILSSIGSVLDPFGYFKSKDQVPGAQTAMSEDKTLGGPGAQSVISNVYESRIREQAQEGKYNAKEDAARSYFGGKKVKTKRNKYIKSKIFKNNTKKYRKNKSKKYRKIK